MRSVDIRPDGTVEIEKAVVAHLKDVNRYLRFRAGENFADIALADGIAPEAVKASVTHGRAMHEAEQLIEIRDLKHKNVIGIERIRDQARVENGQRILEALKVLLEGKRTVVEVNRTTGEVKLHEYADPDVLSMGLEHARKILSIDERPAQNLTNVNIQNNQQNINDRPTSQAALTYEERLKNIRKAQNKIKSITERTETSEVLEAEIIHSEPAPPPDPPETPVAPEWGEF